MFEAKELSGIEAHGLFPKSLNWKTQVRALLGGDFYFLRELEATECLHVLDVPERYFKHSQDEERRALIGLMTHPLKIMQEVAERIDIWVTRRANPAPTSNKRTRKVSEVKSVKFETLQDLSTGPAGGKEVQTAIQQRAIAKNTQQSQKTGRG